MIKKVVIAAAGQGVRMQQLSEDKPKHLIKVNERPFLAYLLDSLITAGYIDIVLVVGFKKELVEEFIKEYLKNSPVFKKLNLDSHQVKIQIVDQFEILGPKEKEYGTACPIKCVKDLVGRQGFIYVVGDNLFSVEDLMAMNIDDEFCYVAGIKQDHPERYGVLIENEKGDDFLKEIIEKPKEFVGDLINTGLYKFTPEVFDKVFKIEKSPRGEYEITDVISLLAKEKKVKIKKIKDYWKDFGKPEDLEKVSKFLKNEDNSGE